MSKDNLWPLDNLRGVVYLKNCQAILKLQNYQNFQIYFLAKRGLFFFLLVELTCIHCLAVLLFKGTSGGTNVNLSVLKFRCTLCYRYGDHASFIYKQSFISLLCPLKFVFFQYVLCFLPKYMVISARCQSRGLKLG